MTELVTSFVMAEIAVVTVAGVVTARLMKVQEKHDRTGHLAPARGIVAGTAWAAVLWTAGAGVFAVVMSG